MNNGTNGDRVARGLLSVWVRQGSFAILCAAGGFWINDLVSGVRLEQRFEDHVDNHPNVALEQEQAKQRAEIDELQAEVIRLKVLIDFREGP